MNKQKFLKELEYAIGALDRREVAEHLAFYSEMIDDRIEEGLSEEDAVAAVGTVEKIAADILGELPLADGAKGGLTRKKRSGALKNTLIIVGFPLWFALFVAAVAVVFSVVVSVFAVCISIIVSLWAAFVSIAVCAPGGLLCGAVASFSSPSSGIAMIGLAIACAGLAVFFYYGARVATVYMLKFMKCTVLFIKECITGGKGTNE